MPIPAVPAVPIPHPVAWLFSHFPLKVYDPPYTTSPAPPSPTLWVLGPPPPTSSSESLDPFCRQAQALARFTNTAVITRWLSSTDSALGNTLPNLHLPDGALLASTEVNAYFSPPKSPIVLPSPNPTSNSSSSATPPSAEAAADAKYQAFLSLVNTTLLPAVLAILYLGPPSPSLAIVPSPQLPFLSTLAAGWVGLSSKRDRIDEILQLRGKKVGLRAVLDLEEVEREGVETLEALEQVLKDQVTWFGGASKARPLDALNYALLSIILLQPSSTSAPLREKLERCPTLLSWTKSKKP
ncbi:hypothetical protein T439DRAFT_321635 [Meredithblackwellia eburnea MCA 4105]